MNSFLIQVNYLAIGTMNPWIEIWDLDVVDTLEPEFILAPEKQEKRLKVSPYISFSCLTLSHFTRFFAEAEQNCS